MEYRAFRAEGVTDDEGALIGLVARYNKRTQIGGEKYGFKEEIAPGTFSKSLQERDIVMLDNHDHHRPVARKSAGTLTFTDNPQEGLRCRAIPADTTYANDLRANIKAGNYGGMSFGFEVIKDDWFDAKGQPSNRYEGTHRVLREVKLIEVSPVTFPAYEGTSIQARDSVLAEREERAGAKPSTGAAKPDGKTKNRDPKKPYGNVAYADPKNGNYPVDTMNHAMAAWVLISQPKNESEYPLNGVKLQTVKKNIKNALKKFGVTIGKTREEELASAHEWRELAERYDIHAKVSMERRVKTGTKKRVPQIITELNAAEGMFAQAKTIPDDLKDAVNLVASANTHAKHIRDIENLGDTYFSKKDKKRSEKKPKPDKSTSGIKDAALLSDDWLREKRHALRAAQMRQQDQSTSDESRDEQKDS